MAVSESEKALLATDSTGRPRPQLGARARPTTPLPLLLNAPSSSIQLLVLSPPADR